MKVTSMTLMVLMVTATMLFMAAPAMAWQPADESHFTKPLNEDGIQFVESELPVEDMRIPLGEIEDEGVPGCEDLGDPDSLNCPGEDGVVPGDDDGIDDGIDDEIGPGDNPGDTPEGDNPDLNPPDDTPDTPVTPPTTTTTTSSLPKTGTYLLALAGVGMIVAIGALGARVMIGRRMR